MADRGSPDYAPSGRPRAAAASAELARRLAASSVSAALQPALAVSLSGASIARLGQRLDHGAVFHAGALSGRRAGYSQHALRFGRSPARHAAVPVRPVRPRLGAERRPAAQATESRQTAQDSYARARPAARPVGRGVRAALERRGFLAVARSRLWRIGSQGRDARYDSCGDPDGRWHGDHARLVPPEHPQSAAKRLKSMGIGLGCIALLTLAMFFDTLIAPGSNVLGRPNEDLALHFLWWREFGFGELAKGNLALWNPHIFSGAPFFGALQSALLYPPNWFFLALPLSLATNWSIALSVWLLGAFMYLWAWRR